MAGAYWAVTSAVPFKPQVSSNPRRGIFSKCQAHIRFEWACRAYSLYLRRVAVLTLYAQRL
jgi:hypothetical protein